MLPAGLRLQDILAALLFLAVGYLLGGWNAGSSPAPPPPAAATLAPRPDPLSDPRARFRFDRFNRLIADAAKTEVPCPRQTDRTAVLLVMGQSNAGNHHGQRMRAEPAGQAVNFFAGHCFAAQSPLLGATGIGGEMWTPLATGLLAGARYDAVVIAPLAIAATEAAQWAKGGELNPLIGEVAGDLQAHGYTPTHVLWHQGESDVPAGTSESAYRERVVSVASTLRSAGVTAPIYVSVASKCLLFAPYVKGNPVAHAQSSLPDRRLGLVAGIDTDALLDAWDRYDDCHFSGSGQLKAAEAWLDLILKSGDASSRKVRLP